MQYCDSVVLTYKFLSVYKRTIKRFVTDSLCAAYPIERYKFLTNIASSGEIFIIKLKFLVKCKQNCRRQQILWCKPEVIESGTKITPLVPSVSNGQTVSN